MRSPGRSAFFTVVVGLAVALGGCTALLGDYTVSDSSGSDGSTADVGTNDVTVPLDSGHDTGTVDDSPTTSDASDANDAPGCGANQIACNGSCVTIDAKNCGTCGHDCTRLPHVSGAGVTCLSGRCVVPPSACAPGFAHCSANPDDGCEADLSQPAHCGTCATTCSGGSPVCSGSAGDGGTGFACSSGCPSATPTLCGGSCVDLTSNAQHCASCPNACPTIANGQPACANSTCGFTCNSAFHSCGGACYADTDVAHCGGACATCSAPANGTPACAGGSCTFSCNANYSPCGAACFNLSNDIAHCGSCGTPCSLPNATASCVGGACNVAACTAGHANCDNVAANGCETNTTVDNANCGGCGVACAGGKSCVGGSCVCPVGTSLCGGICVNLQSDANNCNRCGHGCQGGSCSSGVCQPVTFVSAALANSVTDFTTDGTVVAWLDGNTAVAESMSLGASSRVVLASGATLTSPRAIAMSTTGNGNISWVQYDGTNSQHLVARSGVANSSTLFWTGAGVSNGLVYNPTGVDVFFTRLTGGNLQLLNCASLSPGGCNLVQSSTATTGSFDVAITRNSHIVYGDVTNSTVYQCPIGGTCLGIAGQTNPFRTGGDSANAYWVVGSSQTQMNRAPAGSTTVGSVTASGGLPFTADGTYVYYASGSTFFYVPVGGGTTTTWVTGVNPGKMKYVAGAVYFNDSSGAIMRVATP